MLWPFARQCRMEKKESLPPETNAMTFNAIVHVQRATAVGLGFEQERSRGRCCRLLGCMSGTRFMGFAKMTAR